MNGPQVLCRKMTPGIYLLKSVISTQHLDQSPNMAENIA